MIGQWSKWIICQHSFFKIISLVDDDDLQKFTDKFFSFELNSQEKLNSYTLPTEKDKGFSIMEYCIHFPHEKAIDISDTFFRRFKRMRDDFLSHEKILLIYIARWDGDAPVDKILKFYQQVCKLKPPETVSIYTINAFKENISDQIEYGFVDYKKEYVKDNWMYDQITYPKLLKENLNEYFKVINANNHTES